jgi:hypothetical protein
MSERTIAEFLSLVGGYATYAYFCNPVGKYRPEVAGLAEVSDHELGIALSSGLSQSIIDPWDDASISVAQSRHIAAYTPPGFTCSAHEESRLRPLYLHALYTKATSGPHQ